MSSHQIVDSIRTHILPRLQSESFQLQPSTHSAIPNAENYLPIYPYPPHSHPFFEWVWCVENHAFLEVSDQVFRLEVGDLCLLPPGEVHAAVYTPSLTPYRVLWCSYRDETFYASMNTYVPVNHLQYDIMVFAPAPSFAASLLDGIYHELRSEEAHRLPVGRALASALAHLTLRAFESPLPHKEQRKFPGKISQRVDNYLNQHFSEQLSLADIARALRISRNYLATLYKQETEKTIGQKLTEVRLDYAKKLLLETPLSVQEVSKSAGYARPEHFSRVFLRAVGSTPHRFRNTNTDY